MYVHESAYIYILPYLVCSNTTEMINKSAMMKDRIECKTSITMEESPDPSISSSKPTSKPTTSSPTTIVAHNSILLLKKNQCHSQQPITVQSISPSTSKLTTPSSPTNNAQRSLSTKVPCQPQQPTIAQSPAPTSPSTSSGQAQQPLTELNNRKPKPTRSTNRKAPVTCQYCGKVYTFQSGLSKHLRKHHSDKYPTERKGYIICNICQSR